MKIKRAYYNQKVGEIFNIKEIDGQLILFDDNEIRYNGKLELEYENGKLHSEGMIKSGLKDGQWKTYYQNSEIKIIENFILGKREGIYEEFYKENIKKLELSYKNDIFYGKYKRYFKTGEIELKGFYRDGLKEGEWISYYENGNIYSEANYVNNKIEGKSIIYYENGNKNYDINFINGKKNGFMREYTEKGQIKTEGNYKEDLGNGIWLEYDTETGLIKEKYEMLNNKKNGIYKIYYTKYIDNVIVNQENKDETGIIYEIYNMENDKEEGEYKQFYLDGKLRMKKFFKDGKKEGKEFFFPEKLNYIYESFYENNKLISKKVYYYNEEKKVLSEEFFKYFRKNFFRILYHFDENFNTIRKNIYINENFLERTEYDENGNITYSKKYRKRFFSEEEPEFDLETEKSFFEILDYLIKIKQEKIINKLKLENTLKKVKKADKEQMIKRIKNYIEDNKIKKIQFDTVTILTDEHILEFFEENLSGEENTSEEITEIKLEQTIQNKEQEILILEQQQLQKEKERQEKIKNTFDEICTWLLDLLDQKDKVVFPKKEFLEKIKDFNESEKERTLRVIRYFHSEKKYKLKDDYGNIIEGFNVIKEFGNMLGIVVEESEDTKETEKQEIIQKTEVNEDENLTPEQLRKKYFLQRMKKEEEK